jgi:hypothetical protein
MNQHKRFARISTKATNEEASDFAYGIGGFDQSEGEWIRFFVRFFF